MVAEGLEEQQKQGPGRPPGRPAGQTKPKTVSFPEDSNEVQLTQPQASKQEENAEFMQYAQPINVQKLE